MDNYTILLFYTRKASAVDKYELIFTIGLLTKLLVVKKNSKQPL